MPNPITDRFIEPSKIFRETIDGAIRFTKLVERIVIELHFSTYALSRLLMKMHQRFILLNSFDFVSVFFMGEHKLPCNGTNFSKCFYDFLIYDWII